MKKWMFFVIGVLLWSVVALFVTPQLMRVNVGLNFDFISLTIAWVLLVIGGGFFVWFGVDKMIQDNTIDQGSKDC